MDSRERVIAVIEHRQPDRIPVYGWLRANLKEQISAAFGSVENFEDHYAFDYAHLFGGPSLYRGEDLNALKAAASDGEVDPEDVLDLPTNDPDDMNAYEGVKQGVAHHKEERGRFVYLQSPGIFEATNGVFGIENHMMAMAEDEQTMAEIYRHQAVFNRQRAMNALDLGVDMIHVSDDWGAQRGLMFSQRMWRELIFPNHLLTTQAVKERGAYVSLHSDGNVMSVLDGIVELGYDVVHPFQVSAGMDLEVYKRLYRDRFTVMGGIDIQSTLGFGRYDDVEQEIRFLFDNFRDGGLLLCTSHFVQDHCSIEELVFAYDLITELNQAATPA